MDKVKLSFSNPFRINKVRFVKYEIDETVESGSKKAYIMSAKDEDKLEFSICSYIVLKNKI